jgi:hypothetical protein
VRNSPKTSQIRFLRDGIEGHSLRLCAYGNSVLLLLTAALPVQKKFTAVAAQRSLRRDNDDAIEAAVSGLTLKVRQNNHGRSLQTSKTDVERVLGHQVRNAGYRV